MIKCIIKTLSTPSTHNGNKNQLFSKHVLTNDEFSLQVLNETFPNHTFLLNGLIQGVKVRTEPEVINFFHAQLNCA